MTPELMEFRKWNIVAALIKEFSEDQIDPVVLNIDGISLLVIRKDKAFFFSSYPEGSIAVETWNADTNEMISNDWLFSTPMPQGVTFREITHMAIAKILTS